MDGPISVHQVAPVISTSGTCFQDAGREFGDAQRAAHSKSAPCGLHGVSDAVRVEFILMSRISKPRQCVTDTGRGSHALHTSRLQCRSISKQAHFCFRVSVNCRPRKQNGYSFALLSLPHSLAQSAPRRVAQPRCFCLRGAAIMPAAINMQGSAVRREYTWCNLSGRGCTLFVESHCTGSIRVRTHSGCRVILYSTRKMRLPHPTRQHALGRSHADRRSSMPLIG